MRTVTPYHFNLSVENGEPRVFDLDLADALGFDRDRNIRQLIERNAAELLRYGILLRGAAKSGGRGRPAHEYYLTEGQALLVATLSRTPAAADVRQMLIQAFMDWRQGKTVDVRPHRQRPPGRRYSVPTVESYYDERYDIAFSGLRAFCSNLEALASIIAGLIARVDVMEMERP